MCEGSGRVFWVVAALTIVTAAVSGTLEAATERPNIVLIMADDLGYEAVSPGNESYETPNLDALAESGMRFDNAFANPLCTPSRAKIMTGMYNVRNYTSFGKLEEHQRTFAHQLKKAGYATAIAGKWQLAGGNDAPQHFGFDQSLLWQQTRGRTRPNSGHDTRYPNPRFERNGRDRSFEKLNFNDGEYGPDILTDFMIDFIEQKAQGDQPFLAYFPMNLTHCPFCATPDSDEWDPTSKGSTQYKGPGGKAEKNRHFAEMLEYCDKMVGRIVQNLEKLGVRDNTLIIFTGDNGTDSPIVSQWNGQSVPGGKGQVNDPGMRVPFIASWPGVIPEDTQSDRLVEFSDVLPTLCAVADAPLPEDRPMDGVSLLPTMKGNSANAPNKPWIYTWYAPRGPEKAMARTEHYMVRREIGSSGGTLFRYPKPYNKRKLSSDELSDKQRQIKAKLINVLDRLAATRGTEAGPAK